MPRSRSPTFLHRRRMPGVLTTLVRRSYVAEAVDTIHDYLALCDAQHKAIYVAMSVMLSCFTSTSLNDCFSVVIAHINEGYIFALIRSRSFPRAICFDLLQSWKKRAVESRWRPWGSTGQGRRSLAVSFVLGLTFLN